MSLKVSLCVIVKNERPSAEIMIPQIPQDAVDEIFVIDGNSTDGTIDYFKEQKIAVFQQKTKGLGGATFAAREHCTTNAMIFFHPDGNEDPKDISKIARLLKKGHPFVIPSRMINGARNEEDNQLLKPRKWFNMFLAYGVQLLWNDFSPFTTEIVQGFRGITCQAYDQLNLDRADLTIDFQMMIRALKHKIPIVEFPTIERERLFGETNFQSFATGSKELSMLHQEIFDRKTYA